MINNYIFRHIYKVTWEMAVSFLTLFRQAFV